MNALLKLFDPYRWPILAAVCATLIGAGAVWLNVKIDAAYKAGASSVEVNQLKGEVATLKGISAANKESTDAIQKNLRVIGDVNARVDRADRLRKQDLASFDGRVQRAAEPAVRAYAGQAERDIGAVESQRDGFAAEAVQASAAAWGFNDTLQARRDALTAQRKALKPTEK